MRLWYPKDSGFELTAFSDADHAGCIDTRKSTSGGIQFLGEKLVSWMSKKQDCTAISLAEAEYVALSASCAQVMWMRTQLKDNGFDYNKIPLYYDSQSAIAILCNPVQHSCTKHIHTCYHFIKEQVERGIIELYFIRTEYQLADMFMKALPQDRFEYLVRRIGMRCLTPEELEVADSLLQLDYFIKTKRTNQSRAKTLRVILFIIHSDDMGKSSGVIIKQHSDVPAMRTSKHGKSNTYVLEDLRLSWTTPCQGDSLNLPDHRIHKMVMVDDASYSAEVELKTKDYRQTMTIQDLPSNDIKLSREIDQQAFKLMQSMRLGSQDTRSSKVAKDDHMMEDKVLKIADRKDKSKDNDKGSRIKITKLEGTSKNVDRDKDHKSLTTKAISLIS
ncbi:hypothetical protein Tco_1211212 [Tanacetum coccineum]